MNKLKISSALFGLVMSTSTFANYNCEQLKLTDCPTPYDVKLPDPHNMLTWTADDRVVGFRNTFRLYEGTVFKPNKKHIYTLEKADKTIQNEDIHYTVNGKKYNLDDYIKSQNVSGLIILKNGKVALEYYGKGNTPTTLWTSRSVAKPITSTLIGVAIKQGKIQSIDDPIVKYLPDLKNTAWDKVTLKNLLQHTSGVDWNENYQDPKSHFAEMTYCEATKNPQDCVYKLVKGLKTKNMPGEVWEYNTAGSWLAGLVLEKATGKSIAKNLQDNVWQKFGMEREGIWHSYKTNKSDMGGHGFNATLRDYARFGQFVMQEGALASGEKLLPDQWTKDATSWTQAKGSVSTKYPEGIFGYQWWNSKARVGEPLSTKNADSTFWGFGIFGQMMAINPKDKIVMMQWTTWSTATPSPEIDNEKSLFLNAVTNYLED